jgi:glycosyltransferase involved in cell wall biosynthesis
MARTLYICYFGLREPLVQTQVLPYLRELKKDGIEISILTFEPHLKKKWTSEKIEIEHAKLAVEGIDWHCLAYHKWPSVPATLYDIVRGTMFIRRFIKTRKPDILHGRAHVATLMGALGRKISRTKPKLLFDIRGFVPEEYTDAGIWPKNGLIYRSAKRVERWLMKQSDGFVVLTEKAREILFPESKEIGFDKSGKPVEVIPCCVDFSKRFSLSYSYEDTRQDLGLKDRFVITHLGALGGLYLTRELAEFLATARSRNEKVYAQFLTQSDQKEIISLLKGHGFAKRDYYVGKVSPAEVPKFLQASDIALSFVKSGYATLSRSPTKIPEYLACGVPVIANPGVGDVDQQITENRVGTLIEDFSADDYLNAIGEILELGDIRERCRTTAMKEFDLETVGGERYRKIYSRLLGI